jgi:hypothetical protein
MRPDVKAAFERHFAIEADDGCGHGHVKRKHGADPEKHLRTAQPRGHSHPGAADYIQDLRQHQVAKAELPLQTVLRLGLGLWFGHGVTIIACFQG